MFKIGLNNLLSALHLPDTLMFLLSLAPHLLQLLKRARRINAESGTSSLQPISLQVEAIMLFSNDSEPWQGAAVP